MNHPFDRLPFTENFPRPLSVLSFQAELNKLFGLEQLSSRPWLRIIWAQDEGRDEHGWIAKDWSDYGAGGHGEWRRRYLFSSETRFDQAFDEARGVWTAREVWQDVSPPRFIIERFMPPDIACKGWDNGLIPLLSNPNYAEGRDREGDKFTARKPIEGLYVPLEIDDRLVMRGGVIADHDSTCCKRASADNAICYGEYVVPGGPHLGLLQMMAQMIKAKVEQRPGEMTAKERAAIVKKTSERKEKYWTGFEDRIRQITKDALKTHKRMLN